MTTAHRKGKLYDKHYVAEIRPESIKSLRNVPDQTLADGRSIDINVANLTMNSGAVISSASTGTGGAGNINLTIADKLESRNSTITTESTQADGGDITITNTGFLTYLINSSITATVGGGPQTTGGNIRINSPYVVLKDSHVIANAYEGKGGNIGITADTYLADWTSTVSASSALGISGQVDINSPLVNLSGLLSPCPLLLRTSPSFWPMIARPAINTAKLAVWSSGAGMRCLLSRVTCGQVRS
jgi:hypothetical protein